MGDRYISAAYILAEAENAFTDMRDFRWLRRILDSPNAPCITPADPGENCGTCEHLEKDVLEEPCNGCLGFSEYQRATRVYQREQCKGCERSGLDVCPDCLTKLRY